MSDDRIGTENIGVEWLTVRLSYRAPLPFLGINQKVLGALITKRLPLNSKRRLLGSILICLTMCVISYHPLGLRPAWQGKEETKSIAVRTPRQFIEIPVLMRLDTVETAASASASGTAGEVLLTRQR